MLESFKNKIISKNDKEYNLNHSLEQNIKLFKSILSENDSVNYRRIESKEIDKLKCCLIFIDEMVDNKIINENIIEPIMNHALKDFSIDFLERKIINSATVERIKDINKLINGVLYGNTIVLLNGFDEALLVNSLGWQHRAISEPTAENVVKGPREGFTESISINLSLIRRKILTPDLKFQYKDIGMHTKTKVCIVYLKGVANEKIIKELNTRLEKINIDGILESGYIEEFIRDAPFSPFQTIGHTERPDVVAAKLLEGRIALVVDGTPFVLTLPYIFIEYFQFNEDYYNNFVFSSINRLLRILAFFLTTSIPALYLSLVTYHQELIPTPLIVSIAAAREGVPFPTVFEAFALGIVFEILREAGVRLPTPIGSTVSIVGALVLGDAAVKARFVSAPIVIVIALTGISSFLLPRMLGPLFIIRYIFLFLSALLGLYGYLLGVIGLFIHLVSLRSFGMPYSIRNSFLKVQDIKDTAIRAPWWYMNYRPKLIGMANLVRQKYYKR